ncbi:unnamed protein product [Urochloa humidicola]
MADSFVPEEADDLHHRWLPREIFVDIAIVANVPAEAGVVGVEELAAQLAGILGGRAKVCPLAPPPSPPPATKPASVAAPRHCTQVCGLERSAVVSCAGTNAVDPVAWPQRGAAKGPRIGAAWGRQLPDRAARPRTLPQHTGSEHVRPTASKRRRQGLTRGLGQVTIMGEEGAVGLMNVVRQ